MKTKLILLVTSLALNGAIHPATAQDNPSPNRPPRQHDGPGKYTIAQATSDRAQLNTIAFDGLAFLTGGFNEDTFLPPGKISDFFGFQNMRDVDGAAMGHNTDFLTRIANNTLHILNAEQKAQLVELGKSQAPQISDLALKRLPLIQAFCRNLAGDFPAGSQGLNREAVMKYTAGIFTTSGELAFQRAEVYGKIVSSLTGAQKAEFAKLKFGDSRTWPDVAEADAFDKRTVSHPVHVAMMTYASEFFSWYAGSVEADTYFCPEGHGTYFGSFYMKDAPAVHQKNYSISTALTGDSGEAFLAALNPTQREQVTSLVDLQRKDLLGHRQHAPRSRDGTTAIHVGRFSQQRKSSETVSALRRTRRRGVLLLRNSFCRGEQNTFQRTARRVEKTSRHRRVLRQKPVCLR